MIKTQSPSTLSLNARIVLLLGANITINANASLTPVIPNMTDAFSDVPGVAFWVPFMMTLPALFVVLGGPLVGYLADKWGRKPVLVLSILMAGFGGASGALFNSLWVILATRVFVGLGIAGAMTATNSLIADYYDGNQRSQFMGRQAAIGGLLSVVFLPVGGLLSGINWQLAFLSYAPLLLLLPLALSAIKEPKIITETSVTEGQFDLKLDAEKGYIFSAGFLSQFAFVTVPIYIAYLLNRALGVGGEVVGWLGAGSSLFSFVAGILYSSFSRRGRFRAIAVANYFLFLASFLFLGLGRSWAPIIIGEVLIGFCLGLNNANLANWLSNVVNIDIRGRANGIFATLMSLGPFAAPFIFTLVISRWDYSAAFIISGGIFAVMAVVGLFIKTTSVYVSNAGN